MTSPTDLLAAIGETVQDEGNPCLSIYVHVPFCASKCHFCDWVTDVPTRRLRMTDDARAPYIGALRDQIDYYGPHLTRFGYRPDVMYWGGGTPTRLGPAEMKAVHSALDDSFDLSTLRQFSVETTPNDLSPRVLEALREVGVNRVSVGVQSLDPDQLKRSGRGHSRDQALAAVPMLRAAGIDNFNIDLISSFPGEPPDRFRATLATVLGMDPPHVSIYPYRATPRTVTAMQLDRSVVEAHDAPSMIEAYELGMRMLGEAGYVEYCHGYWVRRPEDEDQDGNHKYDLRGDRIGFGSGAESIIGHRLLWNENTRYADYLIRPQAFSDVHRFDVDAPERMTAQIGGALMTREGVVFERFRRLTGLRFADVRATPYFRRWFDLLADCGAEFLESDMAVRIDPLTVHRAYITHLAHAAAHGMAPRRA